MRPRSNVVKSVLFLVGSDFGVISIPLATAPLFVFSLKSFICNTVQSQSKSKYLLNKFDCTVLKSDWRLPG